MAWLDACGFLSDPRDQSADTRTVYSQPSLQLVGGRGAAETLDLPALQGKGVRLVGRVLSASGREVALSPDLPRQVAEAENRRGRLLDRIDAHIAASGVAAPEEGDRRPTPRLPGSPDRLDLKQAGIATVIWATGFRRAYPWLNVPVTDAQGEIVNRGGVTATPGLFTLGLPFMRHRASTFIDGVGRDAEALAPEIAGYLEKTAAKAA